jgi:hypothetical protein
VLDDALVHPVAPRALLIYKSTDTCSTAGIVSPKCLAADESNPRAVTNVVHVSHDPNRIGNRAPFALAQLIRVKGTLGRRLRENRGPS